MVTSSLSWGFRRQHLPDAGDALGPPTDGPVLLRNHRLFP